MLPYIDGKLLKLSKSLGQTSLDEELIWALVDKITVILQSSSVRSASVRSPNFTIKLNKFYIYLSLTQEGAFP